MTYSEISSSVQNERIAKGVEPETQLAMVPQLPCYLRPQAP